MVKRLDGKEVRCKVIGCNYHIGITIACAEHMPATEELEEFVVGEELYCINGPNSPHKRRFKEQLDTYDREFYAAVRMIKRGRFDVIISSAILHTTSYKAQLHTTGSTSVFCGYGA